VKPLHWIGMGLVIVMLSVNVGGFDLLANWVGWGLVIHALTRLPDTVGSRPVLLGLAGAAGLVDLALWFPAVRGPVVDIDPALSWALTLPQVLFCLLLSWRLSEVTTEPGTRGLLRVTAGLFAVVALLPTVVLGAEVPALAAPAYVLAGFALLVLVIQLFAYGGRDWARAVAV